MMAPLYSKLRADPYHPVLSDRETATLAWWEASLPHMEPRVATPKGGRDERIVYTDYSGNSQISASMILDPSSFKNAKYIRPIKHIRTGGRWGKTFAPTSYIYGPEILAVLTTLMEKGADLANKSVTFYIDNNNFLLAILKNSAKSTSIQEMTGIIWHRIRELDVNPRFERVPPKRNIADLSMRRVKTQ